MAFTKIRETVAAFRSRPAHLTFEDKRRAQHAMQARRAKQEQPPTRSLLIARVVALAVVVLPVSIGVSKLLHGLLNLNLEAVGIITSMILTYAISTLHGAFINRIVALIRPHELSWYFGSKLEETSAALRRVK